MKYLIPFLFLFALGCTKHLPPIANIPVEDGMIYYDTLLPDRDTSKYFNVGKDTFIVTMTFQKFSTGYPLPDIVSYMDNALSENSLPQVYVPQDYSGDNIVNPLGWNFSKNQIFNVAHHDNTLSFLQTDGWIDFTFQGHKIEWYAERFESYGIAGVSIDNGPEVMVDLYHPTEANNSTMVFSKDSLDNAVSHKIRIRYTGQRNPSSNNTNARITHDVFVTYYGQGILYKHGAVDQSGRRMPGLYGLDRPNKRATQQYEHK